MLIDDGGRVPVTIPDHIEFGQLAEQHRRELQVHCYRMVGSLDDAEDLVQESLLRAWRGRDTFQGRSSFRAWLYRISTNVCLDFLARAGRRPKVYGTPPTAGPTGAPPPPRLTWLQPYPDRLLDPAVPSETEPDAVVVAKETIELAFLVAIQHLPPRQRAVLILRDVLGWPAGDTATALDTSVTSVKSALQRARGTLREQLPERRDEWAPLSDPTDEEQALLRRYVDAHERGDVQAVADLLADDVRMTMPPHPHWFVGRAAIAEFTARVFDPASPWFLGQWRCVPIRANRQLAVAHYVERPSADATRQLAGRFRAQVIDVLRIEAGAVVEITSFEPQLLAAFEQPLVLE